LKKDKIVKICKLKNYKCPYQYKINVEDERFYCGLPDDIPIRCEHMLLVKKK